MNLKSQITCLLLSFLLSSLFAQNTDECPLELDGFTLIGEHDAHSYFLSNEPLTWEEASDLSHTLDTTYTPDIHLASIHSAEENYFLRSAIDGATFIGLSDWQVENNFRWYGNNDNPSVNTYNRLFGENTKAKDYGTLSPFGSWQVANSNTSLPFLIEVACSNLPQPLLEVTNISCPDNFPQIGDSLFYEVTVTNNGEAPSEEQFIGMYRDQGNYDIPYVDKLYGSTIVPPLDINESTTVNITIYLSELLFYFPPFTYGSSFHRDFYLSFAEYISAGGPVPTLNNETTYPVDFYCKKYTTDLEIDLQTDNTEYDGEGMINYTLTLTNNGPETAYNIRSTLPLFYIYSYYDFQISGLELGQLLRNNIADSYPIWEIPILEVGQTSSIVIDIDFLVYLPANYTQEITVSSQHLIDTDTTNNTDALDFDLIYEFDYTCPDDITITIPAGQDSTTVSWDSIMASVDCPINNYFSIIQESGSPNGGMFPVGSTTVSYKLYNACITSDSCSFQVNVIQSECPLEIDGFTFIGEHDARSYFLSNDPLTWEEAYDLTNTLDDTYTPGVYLASIHSAEENYFLRSNIDGATFTGLSDWQSENTLRWFGNNDIPYVYGYNNLVGENTPSKDYGALLPSGDWKLKPDGVALPFLLEVACSNLPQPLLEVTDVACPTNFPIPGSTLTYDITITNNGEAPSKERYLGLYRDYSFDGPHYDQLFGNTTVPPLAVGESTTVSITITLTEPFYLPTSGFVSVFYGNFYLSFDEYLFAGYVVGATTPRIAYDIDFYCKKYTTDLQIDIQTDSPVYTPEGIISYTVTLRNNGPETAYNVESRIPDFYDNPLLISNPELGTLTSYGSGTSGKTWEIPVLEANQSTSISVSFVFDGYIPNDYTTEISISSEHLIDTDDTNNIDEQSFTIYTTFEYDCPEDINITIPSNEDGAIVFWEHLTYSNTSTDCPSGNYAVVQSNGPSSGEFFPLGTTEILYEFFNTCGATNTCVFYVNVTQNDCPLEIDGFTLIGEYDAHSYFLSDESMTWEEASDLSHTLDTTYTPDIHLASIHSAEENYFLRSAIDGATFIGLSDWQVENTFRWYGNNDNAFANDYNNLIEDNTPSKDYGVLLPSGNWKLKPDGVALPFLIEVACSNLPHPLLEVTDISCPNNFPQEGDSLHYEITITNNGEAPSEEQYISMYRNSGTYTGPSVNPRAGQTLVPPLDINESTTVSLSIFIHEGFIFPGFSTYSSYYGDFYLSFAEYVYGGMVPSLDNDVTYPVDFFCKKHTSDLQIDLETDNTEYDGEGIFSFTVTITNNGPEDAYNLRSHIPFYWYQNYEISSPELGYFLLRNDGDKFWEIPFLEAGQSTSIVIDFDFDFDGYFPTSFTADLAISSPHMIDEDISNNSDELIFNLIYEFDFTCPDDIHVTIPLDQDSTTVSWDSITATLVCPLGDYIDIYQISGAPNGAMFPVGSTTVLHNFYTSCGLVDSCSFQVNVTRDGCPNELDGFSSIGTYNANAYFLSNNDLTWTEANDIAQELNTMYTAAVHLASIQDAGENYFLRTAIDGATYIGLSDSQNEDSFSWVGDIYNPTAGYNNLVSANTSSKDFGVLLPSGNWKLKPDGVALPFILEVACSELAPFIITTDTEKENPIYPTHTRKQTNDMKETRVLINRIYPNPVQEECFVEIYSNQNTNTSIELIDLNGKVLLQEDVQLHEGLNTQTINASHLPNGLYFIHWKSDLTMNERLKFVKY